MVRWGRPTGPSQTPLLNRVWSKLFYFAVGVKVIVDLDAVDRLMAAEFFSTSTMNQMVSLGPGFGYPENCCLSGSKNEAEGMNRRVSVGIRWVGIVVVAVFLGWIGCSGDDELDFDCETHDECLGDEACVADTCVDAPVEGDPCPDEHAGEEYEDIRCEDGQWERFDLPDPPTIHAVDAEPPTADPGDVIELAVEVSAEDEEELQYQWEAPEAWELVEDDRRTVVMFAPESWGETATIEVEVTDRYDQSTEGEVTVSTHEVDGPEITSIDVEPEPAVPGEHQLVEVDTDHPQELEVEFSWTIPEDWNELETEDNVLTIESPLSHGVAGDVEVTVTDTEGKDATVSTGVSTATNDGPTIDELEAEDSVLEPGETTEVSVEASHALGYEITSYGWAVQGDDGWSYSDIDDETVEVEAPDQYETQADVVVTVDDEFGEETTGDVTIYTEPEENTAPTIHEMSVDDNPVEPGATTQVHVDAEDEYDINYEWSVGSTEDWTVDPLDDPASADLEAPDEGE